MMTGMTGSAVGRFPGRAKQAPPVSSGLPEVLHRLEVAVVGAGRLGTALSEALRRADVRTTGPHGRGFDGRDADVVLLCVPDDKIAGAAAVLRPGPFVGHCSGATSLGVL